MFIVKINSLGFVKIKIYLIYELNKVRLKNLYLCFFYFFFFVGGKENGFMLLLLDIYLIM